MPLPLDVTDIASIRKAAQALPEKLDYVLLNAGLHIPTSLAVLDEAPYEQLMDINYLGVVRCLHAALPSLQKGCHLAVVSSVAGLCGLPNAGAYCASKAAVNAYLESIVPELRGRGIIPHLVQPGFIKTPLTDKNTFPMPFLMPVEKAANRLLGGIQKERFLITFPHRFTLLERLYARLPYWLFFKLSKKMKS